MANNAALLRYFYRIDAKGRPVPGSLIARTEMPAKQEGRFGEINRSLCCTPTTTTTTSSTTTTTTSA